MPPADPRSGSTRRTPKIWLAAAVVLLLARAGVGAYEQGRPVAEGHDLIRWRPIAGAEEASRASGKPVLYDFTADWCPPCHAMEREVFSDRPSAESIGNWFIPVRVLDRMREEGRNVAEVDSLQRRFKIDSFPTLVVVPPVGEPTVLVGYSGKTRLMQDLMKARMGLKLRVVNDVDTSAASPR